MPDGLGLDLIKEIMALRPGMGLIMYTVREDAGLSHSLRALGVTYLTKPASRIGLGEAVRDAASKSVHIAEDGPKRLLIAEDTDSVRDVLARQLEKTGVEADFVCDGKEALKALATGKYGILITDLHMPETDGYALVDAIRAREQKSGTHFPVIALTADVQMAQRETYMRYGSR
ncbi:MAG: response regulator [Alphaproteobacteria bacterium]